jgi:preprotein translocase subunit SecB
LRAKKSNIQAMPPREYNAILDQIQLQDISLEECSAKIRRDRIAKADKIFLKGRISYEKEGENLVRIIHKYELVASSDAKRDFALKISGIFRLSYSSKVPLPDTFLEIFIDRTVPLHTWPYFREFVQNMTQRMNVPPLTLPLLK